VLLKNWEFYLCIHNIYIPWLCLWLRIETCFVQIMMFIHLVQDIEMISTYQLPNWKYF